MDTELTSRRINQLIKDNPVLIFSETCSQQGQLLKDALNNLNVEFTTMELDLIEGGDDLRIMLANKIKNNSLPQIFIGGDLIGDYDDFTKIYEDGLLNEILISLNIIS